MSDRPQRLDRRIVAEGLAESRSRAQEMIRAGLVVVDGRPASRAGRLVGGASRVELMPGAPRWVSRAALKLEHALDSFGLTPRGVALDLGASTGGFTEVLLARGAAHVWALDVGHGQLHPRLRDDPRVTAIEGVNARDLSADMVPPPDWITCDVSFIGLEKALPPALALARPGAVLVALIKPQFEAGPEHVGRGGIVRDPAVHGAVRERIAGFLSASGWTVTHRGDSPIAGADGNREFLIAARKKGAPATGDG
ncbi:MAG: TlyA family RNA methyltransferase [Alphaproteobacteria bacterium]|nr:MAG: TlyA family RNA methyltransferase [Alphaproteobacteria bacterium]